jgi:hypothetical protein
VPKNLPPSLPSASRQRWLNGLHSGTLTRGGETLASHRHHRRRRHLGSVRHHYHRFHKRFLLSKGVDVFSVIVYAFTFYLLS